MFYEEIFIKKTIPITNNTAKVLYHIFKSYKTFLIYHIITIKTKFIHYKIHPKT